MSKTKILHIHADYPDGRDGYPFTLAVKNLLNSCPEYEHFVVSINRSANPFKLSQRDFDNGISFVFWAIPLPVIYQFGLFLFQWWLRYSLRNIQFDIGHAHKLSTEGPLVEYLCRTRKKPYCISIRGGSDVRAAKRYPDLRRKYRKILNKAARVLWVSPWARSELCSLLGYQQNSVIKLPNICETSVTAPKGENREAPLVTVFSFHQYKRKGILPLLEALALTNEHGADLKLDIYGSGPERFVEIVREKITALGLSDQVNMMGSVPHSSLVSKMNQYSMLVLPAINETFGMVYIEAISQGVPFIAHEKTGVDGYFNYSFAEFTKSQSPEEIARAIVNILGDYKSITKELTAYQASGCIDNFSLDSVKKLYSEEINNVLKETTR